MEIDFDFFDLEIIPGLYANGTAEITVRPDGVNDDPEWSIGRIFLHGEKNKPEEVADTYIAHQIYDRLENDPAYAGKINDQIATESLAMRIDRARSYAREFA